MELNRFLQKAHEGNQAFSDIIKTVLFKDNESIFDVIDFHDDQIYTDPFFFAIFNGNENKPFKSSDYTNFLNCLLFGYSNNIEFKKNGVEVVFDKSGRIYIPKTGWIKADAQNTIFFIKELAGKLEIYDNERKLNYEIKSPDFFDDTNIEIITLPHLLVTQFFPPEKIDSVDFDILPNKQIENTKQALRFIREYCPDEYALIETVLKKIILFNASPDIMNSFMSRSAFGGAFFNVYQEDYNEVFLIDDIAHQAGHLIFEAITFDRNEYFICDYNTILQVNKYEKRTVEVFLHALFTYSLILRCLSACLASGVFKDDKLLEVKGRLVHCLMKAKLDFNIVTPSLAPTYFTQSGIDMYSFAHNTFTLMYNKYESLVSVYTIKNQPYNYTHKIFKRENQKIESTHV